MAVSTFDSAWLDGKRYARRSYADGSREYAVHAGSGSNEIGKVSRWQKLPAHCCRMMTKIDAALAALGK